MPWPPAQLGPHAPVPMCATVQTRKQGSCMVTNRSFVARLHLTA